DNFIELYQGIGVTSKFSGVFAGNVFSPRRFNGIIRYGILSPSTPTAKPTYVVLMKPNKTPPTKKSVSPPPTRQPSFNPSKRPVTPAPLGQPTGRPTTKPTAISSNVPTHRPNTATPTSRPSTIPTSPPSDTCGNGSCGLSETSSSCPQDCANIVLTAHNAGTNGAPGVMFDLMASRDVVVRSFDFYTDVARTDIVEVYTRPGSYIGNELVVSGWTLIYSKNVTQMGRNILTQLGDFNSGVSILAGSTHSFFIYTGFYIMYDRGTAEGQVLASDASLKIYEGVGVGGKFPGSDASGMIYSPRLFKGNIRYDAVTPTTPNPTPSPSSAPTAGPQMASPTTDLPCFVLSSEADCVATIRCIWDAIIGACRRNVSTKTSKRM
ncbi:hypothetical protein ACHAW6_000624, partial [Cyclotella cf. meneghiniana]